MNRQTWLLKLLHFKILLNVQPLGGNNFIVTDEDGNRFQLDNKNKTNLADAIDLGKEATELVGSMIGLLKVVLEEVLFLLLVQNVDAIVGSGALLMVFKS